MSGAIEFVVREVGLGSGHRERCVDPVINGERLRDALARVEGRRSGYERALAELTTVAGGLRDAPEWTAYTRFTTSVVRRPSWGGA